MSEVYEVETAELVPTISRLQSEGFDHLACLSGVDRGPIFETVYHLYSYSRKEECTVKTNAPREEPRIPSISGVFKSANWHEREAYDLMGINFDGHPDQRRIFLPDSWIGYPLRKDYDDSFEQEITFDSHIPLGLDHDLFEPGANPDGTTNLLLNCGPQHPSTHGVLRVAIVLDGEKIVQLNPILGYLHRGVEKICETRTYTKVTPYLDRLDYAGAIANEAPYVMAVEDLLGVEVPERAQYLRTLTMEMARIESHMLWAAAFGLDLGAMSPFFWVFEAREHILRLFEKLCGARLTFNYFRIGGVSNDIPEGFVDDTKAALVRIQEMMDKYEQLLTGNEIFHARTKGTGIIPKDLAINYGLTGPMIRGSGVDFDLRRDEPYWAYDKVDFKVPVDKRCDNNARYRVRVDEVYESMKIIEQIVDNLPAGKIMAHLPSIYITPPEGESYKRVEGPKGEYGAYVVSDGSEIPYRVKLRSGPFSNLSILSEISKGELISDFIATLGSIDIVLGDIDR